MEENEQQLDETTLDLVELGDVSEKTQGGPGFNPDGGYGWQFF